MPDLSSVPGFSPDVLPGRWEAALLPGPGGNSLHTEEDTEDTEEDTEGRIEEEPDHFSLG